MRNRVATLAGVIALVAAACASNSDPGSDRLAIVDDTGNVAIVEEGAVTRISDVGNDAVTFQPIWSPDGERLAYVEQGAVTGALVVTEPDPDATAARAEMDTGYFYTSWQPAGEGVAALRNGPDGGLLLEFIDVAGAVTELDSGVPLYFSWEPGGLRLAAHIGSDRLDIVAAGAPPEIILDDPGAFQSPWWIEDGVVALQRGVGSQRLVVVEGTDQRVVADVQGVAQFVVGDGLVAVQSFSSGDALAASLQAVPILPPGRLSVIDLESGAVTEVASDNVAAFFWDPSGRRLLVLDGGDAESGRFGWSVWTEDGNRPYGEFAPEPSWVRNFLPFFDQYAQSMRLWSPDGEAFAYPGVVEGEAGIWVQRLEDDGPERVAEGSWVAWSP